MAFLEIGDNVKIKNNDNEEYKVCAYEWNNGYEDVGYYLLNINTNEIQNRCYFENELIQTYSEKFEILTPEFYFQNHAFPCTFTAKGGFEGIKLGVYENEGPIPHFHFYKGLKPEGSIPKIYARNGGGCICFKEAKYFIHGKHTEVLTKKECDALNEALRKPYQGKDITLWQQLINFWNEGNDEKYPIPENLEIPCYKHNMESKK